MSQILLLQGNPSKRRKSRKHRSAAQRRATAKLVAMNRNPAPKRRRKSRKARKSASVAIVRRSSSRRSVRRARRSFSRSSGSVRGFTGLLKSAAFMGGGALLADVGMGYIAKLAPSATTLTNRQNADGSMNYGYYASKAALIWAMGKYGTKVTRHAPLLATGAFAVLGYEIFRALVPALVPANNDFLPLGYFNPGRIVQGGQLGRIMNNPNGGSANAGMGRIVALPNGSGKGAAASATIRNLNVARR